MSSTNTQHKSQYSAKPGNIEPFAIADNENIFETSQQTSSKNKSFRNGKPVSFQNPLSHRIEKSTNITSFLRDTENGGNMGFSKDWHCSLLTTRRLKYLIPILLFIILAAIAIPLAIHYTKGKAGEFSTGAMVTHTSPSISSSIWASTSTSIVTSSSTSSPTSTSTSTAILISTSTSTSILTSTTTLTSVSSSLFSSTLTSTPISESLCASAEWARDGITIDSNLNDPHDMAIDSEDNIIIADTESHLLRKYFTNGTIIVIAAGDKVPSVFIDKFDNIYFTEAFDDKVYKLNLNDGSTIVVAGDGGPGVGLDQLRLDGDPGIYVDQNSTLYVSDTGNHRVMKYYENATSGIVVAGDNGAGSQSNQLNGPYGIYVDEINEIGAIYICDTFNHRIQKWLPGAIQGITVASNDDQFHSPMSILLAPTTNQSIIMYISSFDHNQILRWIPYAEKAESVVAGLGTGDAKDPDRLFSPRGIKFDRYWNLFVADSGNDRIQKFLFNTTSCATNH